MHLLICTYEPIVTIPSLMTLIARYEPHKFHVLLHELIIREILQP